MWDLVRARVAARRPRLTTSSRSSSAWAWRVPFSHTNELADNPSDASSPAAASTPRRTPTYKVTDFPVESEPNPTDVWDRYAELVATEGPENIAPAVHRVALRKSVPDRRMIRLGAPGMKRVVYENRMRAVVQNMDRAGSQASLDDYHFILTQFAAGGHCMGSRQVLADMIESGVEPTATTFGLVMQAIAHRLFIARRPEQRPGIIHMTKRVLDEVLEKMSTRGVPWTSANMDLAIRILRETTDRQGYEKLLRVAYGVDIRNPDRLALEYAQTPKDAESGPLQLSTAALNTTIDTLGHIAPTSQLVAMFEALTTPLPASRPQPSYALEEDEEDFGVPPDSQTVGRPPCATPNTATYTILMQHLTYHKTLLRHYMLQVMQAEHDVDRRVCGLINRGVALGEIPAHHVAVNRDMISAVWSQAVGRRSTALMKFVLKICHRALRRKNVHFQYYRDLWYKTQAQQALDAPTPSPSGDSGPTPSATAPSLHDSPPPYSYSAPRKYLHLKTHLWVLARDIREIEVLARKVDAEIQRWDGVVRERLGGRVAKQRAVYVSSVGRPVVVSPEQWKTIVASPDRERLLDEEDVKRWEEERKAKDESTRGAGDG